MQANCSIFSFHWTLDTETFESCFNKFIQVIIAFNFLCPICRKLHLLWTRISDLCLIKERRWDDTVEKLGLVNTLLEFEICQKLMQTNMYSKICHKCLASWDLNSKPYLRRVFSVTIRTSQTVTFVTWLCSIFSKLEYEELSKVLILLEK